MHKGLPELLSVLIATLITGAYVELVPRESVSSAFFGWLVYIIPAWTAYVVTKGGTLAVFGLMSLESASLPIPSEVILPLSGFLISQGKMGLFEVFAAVVAGTFVGAFADYIIGYIFGLEVLEKRRFIGASQLRAATEWFKRYGAYAVFFSRMIPGMRSIISFPAGAFKMGKVSFAVATEVGSLMYSSALIYIGYMFGQHWEAVVGALDRLLVPIGVFAVSFAIMYIIFIVLSAKKLL